jgi:hypothetical protein
MNRKKKSNTVRNREQSALAMFSRFLRSTPGPSLNQLIKLSVDGRDSVCKRAFDALIKRKDLTPGVIFEHSSRFSLFFKWGLDLWILFRSKEWSDDTYEKFLSHSCTPAIRREIADVYLRYVNSSQRSLFVVASYIPEMREAHWNALLESDGPSVTIASEFSKFPETDLIAGRWLLDYDRNFPEGKVRKMKDGGTELEDRPIFGEDLLSLLHVPALRTRAARLIRKKGLRSRVNSAAIISNLKVKTNGRGAYVLSDRRGISEVISLLRSLGDDDAFLEALRLSPPKRVQRSITSELLLDRSVSSLAILLDAARLVEPDLAVVLRTRAKAIAKKQRKTETDRLFEQLVELHN